MPENFLILGASSFYGSNFARYVEERGDVAFRCQRYDLLGGFRAMRDVAKEYYIVNFASKSLVAESWGEPEQWTEANLTEFTIMLSALHGEEFKKFIHVSTPESYGHTDGWVDETYTDWKPSTPYAVSRAAADMMLMAYFRAHRFPAIITRTANIYGRGQGANRFIPLAFDTFGRDQRLDLHGGGHTIRSFIHVTDACAATYKIAKCGNAGQTYHISTTTQTSIVALARKICRMLGKRPEDLLGTQPDRLGKDHAYLLDSTKLRNMGWRDNIQLEKGLDDYARP